jgi:branched-chain amino acid transport system substrate-binding protein
MKGSRRRSFRSLVGLAAVTALVAAGCGGDDEASTATAAGGSSSGGSGLSGETIKLQVIGDLTGVAGGTGSEMLKGIEFAVEEANADSEFGNKIELTVADTASQQPKAVNEMSKAVRSDAHAVIFGNLGENARAMAPIAGKAGLPLILNQSGQPGLVESGDHIFRVTGLQSKFQDVEVEYLKQKGVKTIGFVYATDNQIVVEMAEKEWPRLMKEAGMTAGSKFKVKFTDTDFSAIASKLAKENPDAIYGGLIGTQFPTLLKQLRQNGWDGELIGTMGMAYGVVENLEPKEATNLSYAADFNAATTVPRGKEFAEAFKAKTGKEANLFNAEGYDSVQFLKEGVKRAKELSREGLKAGLTEVTKTGYDSVMGKLTFEGRSAVAPGVVVAYTDGKVSIPVTGD